MGKTRNSLRNSPLHSCCPIADNSLRWATPSKNHDEGGTMSKRELKVVRLLEPELCTRCRFADIADVEMADAGCSGCSIAEGWTATIGTMARRNLLSASSCLRGQRIGMMLPKHRLRGRRAEGIRGGQTLHACTSSCRARLAKRGAGRAERGAAASRRSGASIRPASPAGARVDFSSLPRTRPTPTAPGTPTSRRCPFLGNPLVQRVVHAAADHFPQQVNRSRVGAECEVQSALERLGVPSERERSAARRVVGAQTARARLPTR
jgi:hypothetical protein